MLSRLPEGARREQRVGAEVVTVDRAEFVAAERLLLPPRTALERDDVDAALREDLRCSGARCTGTDDAYRSPCRLGVPRVTCHRCVFPLQGGSGSRKTRRMRKRVGRGKGVSEMEE